MNLNEEQRKAVCETEHNLVVTAGAGAGKTTVLSERFIHLLKESGCGVDQILTMTFTKKAAAEMMERIRHQLLHSRDAAVRSHIPRLDSASVSTLDSFCYQIARSRLGRYGLPSTAAPDEEKALELSKRTALEWLLENAHHPVMRDMVEGLRFRRLWLELLVPVSMAEFRIARTICFRELAQQQLEWMEKKFPLIANETIETLRRMQDSTAHQASAVKWVDLAKMLLNGVEEAQETDYRAWASALAVKFPTMIGSNVKGEAQVLREDAQLLKELAQQLNGLLKSLQRSEQYIDFYTLLDDFQKQVLDQRRAAGVMTYNEAAHMAVDILHRDKAMRRYYKEKFRYIMVDEFQDNNELQKELLFFLAEREGEESDEIPEPGQLAGDKLFFVGDEKQSIYRFRGADVSVFKQLGKELAGANGVRQTLLRNYRSEPGLIRYFNRFFASLMPSEGEGRGFEADFSPLESREANLKGPARVETLVVDTEKGLQGDKELYSWNEAYAVGQKILSMVREGVPVSGDEGPRSCSFGDFALLFRTGAAQYRFERVMRQLEIPYESQIVTSFFAESLFGDLNALFQLLLYPDDPHYYAAVLRSPLCPIDDAGILKVLLKLKEERAVWRQSHDAVRRERPPFSAYGIDLSPAQQAALDQTKQLFDQLSEMADRENLTDLLDEVWFNYGLRMHYLEQPDLHPVMEHFDFIRSKALEFDTQNKNLSQWCAWCREKQDEISKLDDPGRFNPAMDAVSIMTIHKSKGLQFPITIVADCGAGGANREASSPFYHSREHGLAVHLLSSQEGGNTTEKGDYLYRASKEEEREMEAAELDRLLYVAMTRSKDHLLFSGFKRSGGGSSASSKSLLDRILEHGQVDSDETLSVDFTEVLPKPVYQILRKEKGRRPLITDSSQLTQPFSLPEPAGSEIAVTAMAGKDSGHSQACEVEPLGNLGEVDQLILKQGWSDLFGTLCHDLLEMSEKSELSGQVFDAGMIGALKRFPAEHREKVGLAALNLVQCYLRSPEHTSLNEPLPLKREAEAEFLLRGEGRDADYIRGRADLVIEYEKHVLVIDYKSDLYADEERYKGQLALYREAFGAITGKPVESRVVFIRRALG